MADDAFRDDAEEQQVIKPRLPRRLAALVGALQGPPDLGVNHDKYLAYPHAEENGGVPPRDPLRHGAVRRRQTTA